MKTCSDQKLRAREERVLHPLPAEFDICLNHIILLFNYAHIKNRRDWNSSCGSFVNAPGFLCVLLQRLFSITHSDDKFSVWRFHKVVKSGNAYEVTLPLFAGALNAGLVLTNTKSTPGFSPLLNRKLPAVRLLQDLLDLIQFCKPLSKCRNDVIH